MLSIVSYFVFLSRSAWWKQNEMKQEKTQTSLSRKDTLFNLLHDAKHMPIPILIEINWSIRLWSCLSSIFVSGVITNGWLLQQGWWWWAAFSFVHRQPPIEKARRKNLSGRTQGAYWRALETSSHPSLSWPIRTNWHESRLDSQRTKLSKNSPAAMCICFSCVLRLSVCMYPYVESVRQHLLLFDESAARPIEKRKEIYHKFILILTHIFLALPLLRNCLRMIGSHPACSKRFRLWLSVLQGIWPRKRRIQVCCTYFKITFFLPIL